MNSQENMAQAQYMIRGGKMYPLEHVYDSQEDKIQAFVERLNGHKQHVAEAQLQTPQYPRAQVQPQPQIQKPDQADNIAQPESELTERLSTLENTMAYTESSVDGLVLNIKDNANQITEIGNQIKALRMEIKDINTELNLAFANIDKMKVINQGAPIGISADINQAISVAKEYPEFQIQLIRNEKVMLTINDSSTQIIKWTI